MSQSPYALKYVFEIPVHSEHIPDKHTLETIMHAINKTVAKIINEILHDVMERYESDTFSSTRTVYLNDDVIDVDSPNTLEKSVKIHKVNKIKWFKFGKINKQ